jgi:hypothetical protein
MSMRILPQNYLESRFIENNFPVIIRVALIIH